MDELNNVKTTKKERSLLTLVPNLASEAWIPLLISGSDTISSKGNPAFFDIPAP